MINKNLVKQYIQEQRKTYEIPYPPEMKKGIRFYSDDSVINKIRMLYLEKEYKVEKLVRLPKIEQIPMKWIENNIKECFDLLCGADWHFTNPEKWN